MATYTGPEVSPVFVTGVVNDSWAKATELTNAARTAIGSLNPEPLVAADTAPVEAEVDISMVSPGLSAVDLDPAEALEADLTAMLRDFIADKFPAMEIPDVAERWRDITLTFNGAELDLAMARSRARIDDAFTQRGLTLDPEAREIQRADHDATAARLRTQQARNTDILYKTHRKGIDLTKWEVAFRAYLDALDAARAFLLGCVLASLAKVSAERAQIARLKDQMQATYFRHLNTLMEASGNDLDLALLEKRITLDADLSGQERSTFVFRQLVTAAVDELQSLASQASAAINRVSADASVSGVERTP
jgi:hypothetical protein